MHDHIKIIDTACPHCGKVLDSSTNADDGTRGPLPGDPSVCNRCALIALFDPEMKLVVPTLETLAEWREVPGLWESIEAAVETVKARNR
jgi:hypothetical protein